jgi:hypothetical protein
MERKIDFSECDALIQNAITSLSSKFVLDYSQVFAPITFDVLGLVNSGDACCEVDFERY